MNFTAPMPLFATRMLQVKREGQRQTQVLEGLPRYAYRLALLWHHCRQSCRHR